MVYFLAQITQNFGQFRLFYRKFTQFWCTFAGLNNPVAYQNWQIWGILLGLVVPLAMFTLQNGPDETFQNGPNETFRNGPDELISMISEIGHCLLTCTSSILNVPLSSSQVIFFHRFASGNSPLWIGRHQVSRRKKMARWFNFETNLYNRENIFSQISQN